MTNLVFNDFLDTPTSAGQYQAEGQFVGVSGKFQDRRKIRTPGLILKQVQTPELTLFVNYHRQRPDNN
jgi:hypothetical protein